MAHDSTAAALLRDARKRSGLTQVALAERAGVTQSVVSAYESGAREPSYANLRRLVRATGFAIESRLRRQPTDRLRGPLGRRLRDNRARVVAAAERAGVTNIRVFGSVARGDERPDSDVDLLVDVSEDVGLFGLGRLRHELEPILGLPVELVPAAGLKSGVEESALHDAVRL